MKRSTSAVLLAAFLAAALAWMLLFPLLPMAEPYASLLSEGGTALLSAVGALLACHAVGAHLLRAKKAKRNPMTLPAALMLLLVAVNNFPFLAVLSGAARVTAPLPAVLLFAALCLAVAALEELVFRALVFPAFARRFPRTPRGIFMAVLASSAIFGAFHLLNLAANAPLPDTLLQVGYSFLVGAAACMLLLYSGNILLPIAFHAVYNFGGMLIPRLGTGKLWDTPTVIFTAAIALLAAVFATTSLFWPQKTRKNTPETQENDFF